MFKSINKIIKVLIFSDIFFNSGWGLIGPIFAIFIVQDIKGGDVAVAGFASAIYWVVKSIIQLPIAKYLDKNDGEKDDYLFMVLGIFISGFVPFIYLVSSVPWHIYLAQIVYAIGMAIAVPAWMAIFTRHIDKGKEAYEWSLYSTALGFGVGIFSGIGGLAVGVIGFKIIYIFVGVFTIISAMLLLLIQKEIVVPHTHKGKAQRVIPSGTPM